MFSVFSHVLLGFALFAVSLDAFCTSALRFLLLPVRVIWLV